MPNHTKKEKAKSQIQKLLREGKLGAKFLAESLKEFPKTIKEDGGIKGILPTKKNLKAVRKLIKDATERNIDEVKSFVKRKAKRGKAKIKKILND